MKQNRKMLAVALALSLALAACDNNDDNDQGAVRQAPNTPASAALSGPNNPTLLGLSDEGDLVQVKLGATGAPAVLRLTGAQANTSPKALDFSPANGQLYVYYSDGRIYTANTATGALTLVGQAPLPSPGFIDAFDFNPVPNAIRALSDQGDGGNYRVSPADASLIATDTSAAYATGDSNAGNTPGIEGVAYTGANGATTTTAYVIDATQDVLARLGGASGAQPSPNSGQLFTVGALGTAIGGGGGVGFDIPTGQTTVGFVSDGSTGAQNADTDIYRIDLATGTLTKLQTVTGKRLVGLAIVPGTGTAPPPPSTPNPTPTPTPQVGLATGNDLCKTALAGTGFVAEAGAADLTCLTCAFVPEDAATLVDTDLENFTNFSGSGLLGLQSLTVKAASSGADLIPPAAGQFVGGIFRLPGAAIGELGVSPDITIETFDDGTSTEESVTFNFLSPDLNGPLLLADLGGVGLNITEAPFFAGFTATKKFDAVQVTFGTGVIGLESTIDLYYACVEGAEGGGFPVGLPGF